MQRSTKMLDSLIIMTLVIISVTIRIFLMILIVFNNVLLIIIILITERLVSLARNANQCRLHLLASAQAQLTSSRLILIVQKGSHDGQNST